MCSRPAQGAGSTRGQGHRRMMLTYLALARAEEILWLVTGASKHDALARLSPQAGDGVDLRIRLIGVGRLAHALAALQGRAERAAQRRDRSG